MARTQFSRALHTRWQPGLEQQERFRVRTPKLLREEILGLVAERDHPKEREAKKFLA